MDTQRERKHILVTHTALKVSYVYMLQCNAMNEIHIGWTYQKFSFTRITLRIKCNTLKRNDTQFVWILLLLFEMNNNHNDDYEDDDDG